ncbi:Hypothetical predicted protein [Podarcis lilfordi]|uniref:Uncharacterized protein n=1 Tax=Podarcis lilfordi TaxID=74358 RepID=A0AA35KF95_9SAUR|nr:Hypothetical predicted protein [Podarcis lilfordi]
MCVKVLDYPGEKTPLLASLRGPKESRALRQAAEELPPVVGIFFITGIYHRIIELEGTLRVIQSNPLQCRNRQLSQTGIKPATLAPSAPHTNQLSYPITFPKLGIIHQPLQMLQKSTKSQILFRTG